MQQVLAKMVDTVAALLETFFGSQNNLSVQGLGAGGLGVPAEILRRMLVSPETERAMMEILPQGRDRELRQKIKIDGKGMYQPNESDFRGWRNEINLKMDRTLNEMGLDKNAARLFKQRTANMAYQIDRLCRKGSHRPRLSLYGYRTWLLTGCMKRGPKWNGCISYRWRP